ncbi:C-type lectin domain family 6 member A [Merluccius polli]|uniref:C-type lectin domain family 6 member A n=1 Tax=Merluccius polli TaxID=89951 RepID=A0AA47PC29_MERPO|nr:C-type lectin domain family 6 member A [Merluccius polli]
MAEHWFDARSWLLLLSFTVFLSELQHSKFNQSALLAYKDHLGEVVGNLTSADENLVMSHSNLSRSCDILQNETQELRTELEAKIKEASRLKLTCAQSPIDAYCHTEPCEDGWIHNRFSCYVIFDHENKLERKTWSEARDACRRRNADLVVINDEEEQALLYDNSYGSTDASEGYWLGLSKPAGTGKWSWVDGTEILDRSERYRVQFPLCTNMEKRTEETLWLEYCVLQGEKTMDLVYRVDMGARVQRRLRLYGVNSKLLLLFFQMILESVIRYSMQTWYGNLSVQLKSKLGRLISTAFKIVGYQEKCYLQSLYEKSVLREAHKILDDPTHILNQELEFLPSGRRLRMPNCRLKRYKNSFIPAAIKMLNKQKHTFKCVVICLGILCVILAAMLITRTLYVFLSELQHSKFNQSALLAYKDHLGEVVGNLTSADENLVMSHSNLSRSCDILQNETQELRTELEAKIKEASRLKLTCAQSPIDAYCHTEYKSSVCRPCEDGWIHNRSSCYVIFDHENKLERKTWSEARDACRRRNADLVVINDEEEQALLYDNSYGSTDASEGYWLGLSKPAGTGKWSWVDGTEVTLRYWTGVNGTGSNSLCALIWKNEQKKPFGWSTVYCKEKRRWMCEKKIFSYQVGKK